MGQFGLDLHPDAVYKKIHLHLPLSILIHLAEKLGKVVYAS